MNNLSNTNTLIIDIGKTNIKLHVLNTGYQSVFSKQMSNTIDHSGQYPSTCVDTIWSWLCSTIKDVTKQFSVGCLTITTHGATAALIDRNAKSGNGLVLPVLDYEYANVYEQSLQYETIRPSFEKTYSPSLPAGLNLGRQLYWLKQNFSKEFEQATDILMYPQYWGWRFTGQRFSEITSLGCHTDLWSIKDNDYSPLVDELACRQRFPEIKPAWYHSGNVSADICEQLGLEQGCQFYNGLHDSNASFLRYRLTQKNVPFTVVSTGTWTISMASQVSLTNLQPSKDMLANVDALGSPIACARFMGGREFEAICERAGSWLGEQFTQDDLQRVIDQQVFALPDFSEGSGPFGGNNSGFVGSVDQVSGIALATIYCALMIHYQLTLLQAQGNVFIEGAFLKNPLLCAVLNQLCDQQEVYLSLDDTGTVLGAAYLTNWENVESQIETKLASKTQLTGLIDYKNQWLSLCVG